MPTNLASQKAQTIIVFSTMTELVKYKVNKYASDNLGGTAIYTNKIKFWVGKR